MAYPRQKVKDLEYNYFYDDNYDKKYCYSGTNVLKNKLNIRDLNTLHDAERDYSSVRQAELDKKGVTGDFSLNLADISDKKEMSIRLAYYRRVKYDPSIL